MLGNLETTKEYCDRALAIPLKKLGPEHLDVAATYNNLGNSLQCRRLVRERKLAL